MTTLMHKGAGHYIIVTDPSEDVKLREFLLMIYRGLRASGYTEADIERYMPLSKLLETDKSTCHPNKKPSC